MQWDAAFEHFIFVRLIKEHDIPPLTAEGQSILAKARARKERYAPSAANVEQYANSLVDEIVASSLDLMRDTQSMTRVG